MYVCVCVYKISFTYRYVALLLLIIILIHYFYLYFISCNYADILSTVHCGVHTALPGPVQKGTLAAARYGPTRPSRFDFTAMMKIIIITLTISMKSIKRDFSFQEYLTYSSIELSHKQVSCDNEQCGLIRLT